MPIYEYGCGSCDIVFPRSDFKIGEAEAWVYCPDCKQKAERIVSLTAWRKYRFQNRPG